MPVTNATLATGVGKEGEKSSSSRPPIVLWAYPDWNQRAPLSSITHPKPPHYHDSLSNDLCMGRDLDFFDGHKSEPCGEEGVGADAEVELNVDLLVGVKSAEETLKPYEIDVGFYYAEPDPAFKLEDRSIFKTITEDDIAAGKERWADLVQNLTGGLISSNERSRDDIDGLDLRSPTSSEFFDLTDSEHSVDSDPVPSTPKPGSYVNFAVKQASPSSHEFSPPRSLNASASSFIPTSTTPNKVPSLHFSSCFSRTAPSPSPSPTYSNFTFPSLNTSHQPISILPPTLKKDEQGFYTEVSSSPSVDQKSISQRNQRSSTSLLPPFLADQSGRARKTSKTRKIVDQLRSASANSTDRPNSRSCVPIRPVSTPHQLNLLGASLSTADEDNTRQLESDTSLSLFQSTVEDFGEDGDGWLRVELEDISSDLEVKTRRKQHLVHALGRNRPDLSESDVNHKETGWEIFTRPTDEPKKSGKEASSTRRKSSRQRSRKSHGGSGGSSISSPTALPTVPLPLSSLPPSQPFFPVHPIYATPYPYAASPYKTVQMPAQTLCFPTHPAYAGAPIGPITWYPPVISPKTLTASMNMQGGFDRATIAGGTGMTHAQW